MLEFLASVDPMSVPVWAVLAFSLAMYPVGILLPSCLCCQQGGCSQCENGQLPDTVTVAFSGLSSLRSTGCCGQHWNGKSVVLQRDATAPSQCLYRHLMCGGESRSNQHGRVEFEYFGPTTPPVVRIVTEVIPVAGTVSTLCDRTFTAPSGQTYDCAGLSVTATSPVNGTAVVTAGGTYSGSYFNPGGYSCLPCCSGNALVPPQIAVEVSGTGGNRDGTYVISANPLKSELGQVAWSGGFTKTDPPSTDGIYLEVRLKSGPFFGQGTGPGPAPQYCTTCENRCGVEVRIDISTTNGSANPFTEPQPTACIAPPICNPYGTYAMSRAAILGGGSFTAVISAA